MEFSVLPHAEQCACYDAHKPEGGCTCQCHQPLLRREFRISIEYRRTNVAVICHSDDGTAANFYLAGTDLSLLLLKGMNYVLQVEALHRGCLPRRIEEL